ncbi:TipJ family phage tail tip protein [Megasphaera sp.]|uniref:TipJ family phage tail tip protein n=1 Tax=Megasphaera sp. TaxID=2023260 RepID=UPI0040264BF3
MIDIILVKNIFDDHPKTEIQSKDYIAGMTLAGYVDMRDKDAYVGGMWVRDPKTFYVKDGMQFLILPHVAGGGFKKILGTVLMVGLMIAAPAMFVGWSSLALRALASGAVMILGGKIINSIFHLNQAASRGVDDQSSPTYGWELPNVQTQEGGVIGETFGECIPAPQLLMYHVETTNSDDQDKNNQYLNVLYCGGYGPVESIDAIRIGHTPIENFSDVQIETRKGTNNQSPIPFFGSTVADQSVDMTLAENKPVVRSTDMENCNRIDVTVSWPSGLYHMNDDGNYEGCTAKFRIEYRKTGTSDWHGGNMYEAHSSSSLISNVTAGAKADRNEVWTIDRQDTTTRVKVRNHYRTETTRKWVIRSNKRSEVFDLPALNKGDRYDNGYIAFTRERVFSFRDGFSLDGVQIYVQKCDYYITKATNSGVRRSYAIKGLEPARYDVRVTALSLPHTSRDCSFMQWNTLSSFADDSAYSRPNKVLVALRIKATNQINGGVPDINWRQRRTIGYAWNPETQAYEQVDLRNPVWAAYDILHHCRKLFNVNTQTEEYHVDGCPKERFTQYWDQWQAAADYADEDVKNADGSTEPRFRFDAYYDTSLRRYEAANKALAVAHATLVRHGLQLGVVVDKPGVIHQVFGEGRTLISSVKGEFSATEDRAHSLQVTYNDTQNDFKNTEFFIRSDAYASAEANGQDNTAQLSLFGVSSRTQAYREAVYALATNERQLQTIQFSADINAIVCEYGDIIGVSHSVARIGLASGRIVAVDGNTITLDKDVTLDASESYGVKIQLSANDHIISRDIKAVAGTSNKVTVTTPFDADNTPAVYDTYALGVVDKIVQPFRITKVEKDSDEKVSLTCVQYDEAIYDVDYSRYPVIDYTAQDPLRAPVNLTLVEQAQRNYAGVKIDNIVASWQMPGNSRYESFRVYYSVDGVSWTSCGSTTDMQMTIGNVDPTKRYQVRVSAVLDGVESAYVLTTISLTGNIQPAVEPENIVAYTRFRKLLDGTDRYDIAVSWGPDGLIGRVYYKPNHVQADQLVFQEGVAADDLGWCGPWTYAGTGVNQFTIPQCVPGDTYRIAICTANELGEYTTPDNSPHKAILCAARTTIPNTPGKVSVIFAKDRCTVNWEAVTNTDIAFYEIRTDTGAGTKNSAFLLRTNSLTADVKLTERTGRIYVFACGTDGKYSAAAELSYNKPVPVKPGPPIVTPKLGGISIVAQHIPTDCIGVKYHINSAVVSSFNNQLAYTCDAGIYNVSYGFYDLFGEGKVSEETTVVVKVLVDQKLLEDGAVSIKKVDETVTKAIEDASNNYKEDLSSVNTDLSNTKEDLSRTKTNLNAVASDLSTKSKELSDEITGVKQDITGLTSTVNGNSGNITQLQQRATDIETTVADNNTKLTSQIQQNAGSISTVVANLNSTDLANSPYKSITTLKQTTDSISSTVSANKSATDSQISQIEQTASSISSTVSANKSAQDTVNASLTSKIQQNADSITSVVTNLSDPDKAKENYSAISQMQDDINLRVAKGDVISQINLDKTGTTIDGKLLHVTGDTVIEKNVIAKGMIQAGAVTTDNLAAGSVTADKIKTGSLSAISATIGTLRSSTSGARMELTDNLICIYDSNNVLRVKLGVWS